MSKIKAKVLMISTEFPVYHPRRGEQTQFVAKIVKALPSLQKEINAFEVVESLWVKPKFHTIRPGKRWKSGDYARLRTWTGQPYKSKQREVAIVPVSVLDFQIKKNPEREGYAFFLEGKPFNEESRLIQNDGLDVQDFWHWFKLDNIKKPIHFDGQIICWGTQAPNY